MFTGIVEQTGKVVSVTENGSNLIFSVQSPISHQFSVDQSVSHDGVCLTVTSVSNDTHEVTAIQETLKKTNLVHWKTGTQINLERCMPLNGRLDGHIVQGHVDTVAECLNRHEKNGSWEFEFCIEQKFAPLIIEKGSIAINGISLTLFDVGNDTFKVAIIPYTFNHTGISLVKPGDIVNIEFDIVGKYIQRMHQLSKT